MKQNDIPGSSLQTGVINTSRELWRQRFLWNKAYLVNIVCDFGNSDFITQRTLENLKDFAAEFRKYYGFDKSRIFESILTDYFYITEKLLKAIKAKNVKAAEAAGIELRKNADEIAGFLAAVNPYWDSEEWRKLLYENIKLIEDEANFRIKTLCTTDLTDAEVINNQIMKTSDYMAMGIIRHFKL